MTESKILLGNACFLVRNTSEDLSKKDFEDYLNSEGFEKFRKYGWCDRGCYYVNVKSLRFSAGVPKPVKLAETIVGESIGNPFTIDEFKTIWNILKKHIKTLNSTNEITKGHSAFIIRAESEDDITDYLNQEFFRLVGGNGGSDFFTVNVKRMIYSNGISSFEADNSDSALTVDEFKTIWSIIRKHHKHYSYESLLKQCKKSEDPFRTIELSDKILEIDKNNSEGLYYRANALFNIKEHKKAIELLDHAIAIYPDDYRFYNTLAFIYMDSYDFSQAINCFNFSFALGGFDGDDRNAVYEQRAMCYLKKSKEDIYIKKDLNEALKSINIYLNQFPDDEDALRLKELLSQNRLNPNNIISYEKLMYFECKAYKLYKLGYLKESFESYIEVLKAVNDFNNCKRSIFTGIDIISGGSVFNAENFRWYKEVLAKSLLEFNGNYHEFFKGLFEISDENISACIDKAKLYSLIYTKELTCDYLKKLITKCPSNSEAKDYYDELIGAIKRDERLSACFKFKNYNCIGEYADDVRFCLIHLCGDSEETAENFVKNNPELIKRCYDSKYPAHDLADDNYPLCG